MSEPIKPDFSYECPFCGCFVPDILGAISLHVEHCPMQQNIEAQATMTNADRGAELPDCENCNGHGEIGHFEHGAAPGWVNEACPACNGYGTTPAPPAPRQEGTPGASEFHTDKFVPKHLLAARVTELERELSAALAEIDSLKKAAEELRNLQAKYVEINAELVLQSNAQTVLLSKQDDIVKRYEWLKSMAYKDEEFDCGEIHWNLPRWELVAGVWNAKYDLTLDQSIDAAIAALKEGENGN